MAESVSWSWVHDTGLLVVSLVATLTTSPRTPLPFDKLRASFYQREGERLETERMSSLCVHGTELPKELGGPL